MMHWVEICVHSVFGAVFDYQPLNDHIRPHRFPLTDNAALRPAQSPILALLGRLVEPLHRPTVDSTAGVNRCRAFLAHGLQRLNGLVSTS